MTVSHDMLEAEGLHKAYGGISALKMGCVFAPCTSATSSWVRSSCRLRSRMTWPKLRSLERGIDVFPLMKFYLPGGI